MAAVASGGAWAQANPYYIGAAQSLAHESNYFRAADGGPRESETVSITSLLAGLDQPIGRQRLFADAALRAFRHADNRQLDTTGGSLFAGVDLSAVDVFTGRVSANVDKALARYGADLGFFDTNQRVSQTSEEFVARGQYGLIALLTLEGGFVRRKLSFSVQSPNEFEQDTVSAGLKVRPTGELILGVAVRRTDGTYPFALTPSGGAQLDDFKRDDVDLSAVWALTAASTFTARVSRTSEKHEPRVERNVSGTTGAVSWNFKPTGKLNLVADYVRDTGAESSFNQGAAGGLVPAVNSNPLSTTWQLLGEYEATAKIQVVALVRQHKRDLIATSAAGVTTGSDKLQETRIGANWTPLRSVLVGCTVGQEKRETDSILSAPYSATTVRCMAQFKTQ